MLKRYIAFVFKGYGAPGGWNDVIGDNTILSFDTAEEAEAAAKLVIENYGEFFQVVDLHEGHIVATNLGEVPPR